MKEKLYEKIEFTIIKKKRIKKKEHGQIFVKGLSFRPEDRRLWAEQP